jgi:gliding motility-associated-like protein
MIKKSTIITLVFVVLGIQTAFTQVFPNPISLSTGQGAPGSNDPIWLVSQQCFSSAPPNPTSGSVTFSPAVIQNPYNAAWIDPATLPAPVNNGDWIGFSATSAAGDNSGCYRYFRLPITLPPDCGGQSVTVAGNYVLTFDGYVDNTITAVYVNGVNMGIAAGGGFSAGTQLTFSLPGPWLVGINYIDVQVFNGPLTSPDPSGLLLVASPSAGSADSDGDGVLNINDACPCTAGTTNNGCPAPNNCNLTAIRSAYTSAGCTELTSCYDGCSLYFYYPVAGTSAAAESFAQTLGGHIVSIQSATENACLANELNNHGYSGVIWIGYTDVVTEGTFLWLDGSPFGYTNWNTGEPNNAGGNENCTQMYPNGTWNDLDCSLGAASILEVGLCPQATIITPTNQICAGASMTLSVSTVLGSAPYSYTWSPAAGLSATNVANPIASPSVTTTYTAMSVDRYGCTAYAYTTITVNPLPVVTVNSATICLGQQTATLTANGATSYTWSAGLSSTTGASVNGSPLTTTSYTVSGSDVNGCIGQATSTITVNSLPIITATSGTICLGQQSTTLTASSAVIYSWTPSSGLNTTTGAVVVANPSVTTTYSVGGLDANGCANFTTTIVTVRPLPILSATSGTICLGQQTTTLTVNGGVTYSWTPATGLSSTTGSVVTASPSVTTTYSVGGIDINGCANYTTTSVTVNSLPSITANNATICIGQQTGTLTANGGVTYSWTPATGLSATSGSVVTANPLSTSTYSVGGIDANGCANFTTAIVTANPLPTISVNNGTVCIGQQSATLTATGASTYSWTPATGLSSTTGAVVVANPSVNTTYTITGTNTNGCTNTVTAQVTVNPLPIITATSGTICIGQQTVALTASGGVTYSWTPAIGLSATTGATVNASPLVTTTYSVGGINANGCANYTTTTVTVKPLPVLSANNATICIGQQTATITANGGVTYSWTPATGLSATTGSVVNANPTTSTTYSIGGIGANGCLNYTTSIVTVKPLPLISVNSSSICLGQQTATLTANGAATYSWTPAATLSSSVGTTVNGTPTVNTTYTIVGTDVNGCINGTSASIYIYPLPTASLSINTTTICIGSTVTITPSGANSYVLTPGNLFSTSNYVLTPTVNTVYSVVGTNTNNCFSTNNPTVAVTVYTLPIISAQSDATINIGQTATVTAYGGLTYLWSPVDGLACASCATTAASPYVTTIYIVAGFDMYGCKNVDTVVVTVDYICADFFVPNVFSPNGDGLNDVVNIHGACIATYNFQIFNRWGELVFETKDPAFSWDGTFRGKPMDTGVFMYSADGITRDGKPFSAKGNITLLR